MLEPCALSSACLVSCWSVVFGSRHSCLEFRFRGGVRTLTLHFLSCCVSVRSRVRSSVLSSVHMCCVLYCCTQFVAFVLVFCVPCALMSIVLTPPILLPDYWFICPTCVYLVTLLICSLYNLVFAVLGPVRRRCYPALPCPVLPSQALSCCQPCVFSPTG